MVQTQPRVAAPSQGVGPFTSFDAKVAQYKYAIFKCKLLITRIDALVNDPDLVLVHYVVPLAWLVFAISEPLYSARLQKLIMFQLFKPGPVTLSPAVIHIPYDAQDYQPQSLDTVPSNATAQKCLKTLDILCHSALQGYQKRLQQALMEPNSGGSDALADKAVAVVLSAEDSLDLSLPSELVVYPISSISDNSEATLMDFDIQTLLGTTKLAKQDLDRIKPYILKFKSLSSLHQLIRDRKFRSLPEWQSSMHVLMMLAIRLNDLYTMLRRIGRYAYITNHQHLYDQRLAFQSRNPAFFRQHVLADIDNHLCSHKKNGPLIATLTRLLRLNALHSVDAKSVVDFAGHISQGLMIVEKVSNAIEDFALHWVTAELRFRKVHNLPVRALIGVYNKYKEPVTPAESPRSSAPSQTSTAHPVTPNKLDTMSDALASLSMENKGRTSRSSSISSTSSAGSLTLRPGNRHSMIVAGTLPTPAKPRPVSAIFLNPNSSIPTISNATLSPDANTTTPTGRRRSNSQPIRSPLAEERRSLPTARSPAGSIKSPVGSIRRSLSLTKRNPKSPSESSQEVPPAIAEEQEPHLTASQRFQAHLRLAAKSGTLMTQEKEVLNSVVFDPNDPSRVNLGRKTPAKETNLSSSAASAASKLHTPALASSTPAPAPVSLLLSKRDQVTRQNTKKNSVKTLHVFSDTASSVDIETRTTSSESSVLSSGNSSVMKKVRFSGVPDYTEAEDAPTKFLDRLLKNFAAFKPASPTIASFRRRDQLLREESHSFKTHDK